MAGLKLDDASTLPGSINERQARKSLLIYIEMNFAGVLTTSILTIRRLCFLFWIQKPFYGRS
jgi:hypothetical protein